MCQHYEHGMVGAANTPAPRMSARFAASPLPRLLAVLFAVAFATSGLRLMNETLRADTRATAPLAVRSPADRGKRAIRRRAQGHASGTPAAVVLTLVLRIVRRFARPSSTRALAGLPPGSQAGSGVPRSRRWLSLGGHGRHGAGSLRP